jgi:PqqD family protein of HPr-rel-A system
MDDPRFAAPAPDTLIAVQLDGLVALYDRASAMTHVLAEPAPEILEALGPVPLTATELLTALDLPDDTETRPALLARLEELEVSGLVRRV